MRNVSDFLLISNDAIFTHAHVSDFLLISMMIPIIKDKLGDHTSSDNYRSIAIREGSSSTYAT